ncbi:MAG TPA: iron-sulfur cluster repair di-iron protein [Vicinamibacterales bacterium]|jgi:regulator of cell morphogenesis and NO signaling
MNQASSNATIGDIVATDFRTAVVFEQFGIDFCCGGRRSFADACREAAADPELVRRALDALPVERPDDGSDLRQWPVDRLIEHVVSTHHAYVRAAALGIAHHLAKLVTVHGERHPELARIAEAFEQLSHELQQHMMKEEHVLFPYIRELGDGGWREGRPSPFGSVENPIRMMEKEHRAAGDEMHLLRLLTSGYTPPDDACTTYRVCFAELAQFERDLHRHVHLENNVLFPKAVELERRLWR